MIIKVNVCVNGWDRIQSSWHPGRIKIDSIITYINSTHIHKMNFFSDGEITIIHMVGEETPMLVTETPEQIIAMMSEAKK